MLSQQGCRIVITAPVMPATSHRGCVHAPWPPSKTNSSADGLRQEASVASAAVRPVAVCVNATGLAPEDRGIRLLSAKSWRVRRVAGTGTDHSRGLSAVGFQPVTGIPPLITGRAPGAADQTIWWPSRPESCGPNRSGADNRYVPPASTTWTSAMPAAARWLATVFAVVIKHGCRSAHAPPCPAGAAYTVITWWAGSATTEGGAARPAIRHASTA